MTVILKAILRLKQVEQRTGLSRSTIYRRISEGSFPRPVRLGKRAVGWRNRDIDTWEEALPVGSSQTADAQAAMALAARGIPPGRKQLRQRQRKET